MTRPRFQDDRDDLPPRSRRTSNTGLVVGLLVAGGLLVVLVCGGGVAYLMFARTAARDQRAAAAGGPAATDLAVGPADGAVLDGRNGNPIVNEFSANPIAAERKWLGKRVRIWNSIGRIDRDAAGWYVPFEHCDISLHIAPDQAPNFSKLARGTTVEVEAVLDRFTMTGRGGTIPYLWGKDARLVGIENARYPQMGKDDPQKTYTRDEFRRLVIDKTPAQVLETVGPPGKAMDDLNGNPRRWVYSKIAALPTERKAVWVWFKDGKANEVADE